MCAELKPKAAHLNGEVSTKAEENKFKALDKWGQDEQTARNMGADLVDDAGAAGR